MRRVGCVLLAYLVTGCGAGRQRGGDDGGGDTGDLAVAGDLATSHGGDGGPGADLAVPDDGGCGLRTCMSAGVECGPIGDGCGGVLDCGTCPMGESCGAGGPGKCGKGMCTPTTCKQQGFNCGMAGDGCGNAIDCGTCTMPNTCGGGGMANVCGKPCVNLCKQQMMCKVGTTTISGTVLAPTNPQLGYGNPDPLPNALVYVPNDVVQPFKNGVSCGKCGAEVTGAPLVSVNSGVDGKFVLPNAPCGMNIPLVIQLGRWRRHIVIPNVACCADTPLTADQTRFPRTQGEGNDPLNNIPLIAISTGQLDPIECVLPKIGIDLSQFTDPAGNGRVRLYTDNGATIGNQTQASALYDNPAELAKYDAVVFSCVGIKADKTKQEQQNVIDYANNGGRVFASHYGFVWLYNVAPFSGTAVWNVDQPALKDMLGPYVADVDTGFPKGMLFGNWLKTVGASQNGTTVLVQQERHDFDAVVAPSQRWLYLDLMYDKLAPGNGLDKNPLEYTFNTPVGAMPDNQCGRVLFSDFHVNTSASGKGGFPAECGKAAPLTPQEKILEFMIFDLTSCVQPDVPMCTPTTCQQLGYDCGKAGDGCGNLIDCGTCPNGQTCGSQSPNVCGGMMCTPTTCQQLGYDCGKTGDGCGNVIDCGTCPNGQTCGGTGQPNVCGGIG